MEFFHFLIFSYLSLALVASHAAVSPADYWKSVLPNTPMPNAITELLQPEWIEDKSTSVGVGKGGVHVDAGKGTTVNVGHKGGTKVNTKGTHVGVGKGGVGVSTGKPGGQGTSVGVGKGGVGVSTGKPGGQGTNVGVSKGGVGVVTGKPGGQGTHVGVGKGGVGVVTGKPGKGTNVHVGKGGITVGSRGKGKPVYVGVRPGPDPFMYNYAASVDQLQDSPNVALFFLEKDMKKGTKMNLHFTKRTDSATFLPRQVAEKIPFSSERFPEILNQFSVEPQSTEAETMKQTVKECEDPSVQGEEKYCATSLESMVDFSTSKLGKNVNAVSTEVEKETQPQKYSFEGVKKVGNDKAVVCHKQNYVYGVFYCHKTQTTRPYLVALAGADGTKSKAVAVCHTNTASWNPKHLAFQVLRVKPGSVPICHFLPEDHVVWVPY